MCHSARQRGFSGPERMARLTFGQEASPRASRAAGAGGVGAGIGASSCGEATAAPPARGDRTADRAPSRWCPTSRPRGPRTRGQGRWTCHCAQVAVGRSCGFTTPPAPPGSALRPWGPGAPGERTSRPGVGRGGRRGRGRGRPAVPTPGTLSSCRSSRRPQRLPRASHTQHWAHRCLRVPPAQVGRQPFPTPPPPLFPTAFGPRAPSEGPGAATVQGNRTGRRAAAGDRVLRSQRSGSGAALAREWAQPSTPRPGLHESCPRTPGDDDDAGGSPPARGPLPDPAQTEAEPPSAALGPNPEAQGPRAALPTLPSEVKGPGGLAVLTS